VSDTGIGIDLSQQVDIFGQFQQVQAASGSAGLGLFIAQRIVSAMGGSLNVASVIGQGTTFSFTLFMPIVNASDSAWSAATPQEVEAGVTLPRHLLPRNAILDNQALEELASLALDGRLTDVECWIERHSDEVENAPFVALLSDLLERLDFPGIHALCVAQQEYSSPLRDIRDQGPRQ